MSDDFAMRELCPDGGCIGVIGPDGTCKECGKPSPTVTQNPRFRGMVTTEDDGGDGDDDEAFDDARHLCPDDSCVGVLDDDGVCPECGAVVEREDDEDDEDEDDWDDEEDWVAHGDADEDEDGDEDGDGDGDEDDGGDEDGDDGGGEFDDRRLCPDGGCIGLIGADGACKECGARPD